MGLLLLIPDAFAADRGESGWMHLVVVGVLRAWDVVGFGLRMKVWAKR